MCVQCTYVSMCVCLCVCLCMSVRERETSACVTTGKTTHLTIVCMYECVSACVYVCSSTGVCVRVYTNTFSCFIGRSEIDIPHDMCLRSTLYVKCCTFLAVNSKDAGQREETTSITTTSVYFTQQYRLTTAKYCRPNIDILVHVSLPPPFLDLESSVGTELCTHSHHSRRPSLAFSLLCELYVNVRHGRQLADTHRHTHRHAHTPAHTDQQ